MTKTNPGAKWERSSPGVFWGQIAPSDHLVQIYDNENVFLDILEGFAGSGLRAGDNVIIIATSEHLARLEERLTKYGFDIDALRATDQYMPFDAVETLSKFVVNDWPDEKLFTEFVTGVIRRGQKNGRKVRAFGEMVAILWAKGFNEATMQLENLWSDLHQQEAFTLYCAYPRAGFNPDKNDGLEMVCCSHSKVIDSRPGSSPDVYYKTTAQKNRASPV